MENKEFFDRQIKLIGEETNEKIKSTSILVVGVGAGGNELLKNLILMGFGHFTIVDFDFIEDSNLSRTTLFRKSDIGKSKAITAAERLLDYSLHESPVIKGIHGNIMQDIGPGIFINHDIIVCCVDTLQARAYINDWSVRLKKPFFEMGFEKMNVDISFFDPSEDNAPCLRELIGQKGFSEKRNSCSGLKIKDEKLSHIPTIQVASAMAGVLIAIEIIKFLQGKSTLKNKILQYYGMDHRMNTYGIDRSKQCLIHQEPQLEYLKIKADNQLITLDFLNLINEKYHDYFLLTLPERFVIRSFCEGCGKEMIFNKRFSTIFDEERWCRNCRSKKEYYFPGNFEIISEVHVKMKDTIILQRKLYELGILPMDLLLLKGIKTEPINILHLLLD